MFLSFVVGFSTSIAAGAIPLAQKDMITNFLVAFIPLLGTSLNDILLRAWRATFARAYEAGRVQKPVPIWWGYFRPAFFGISIRTAIGVATILIGLQLPIIWELKSPGLALLGLLVVGLAVHQLYLGAVDAKSIRREGETFLVAYLRSRATLIATGMFGVAFWVVLILLFDAGQKLYQHS